MKTSFARRGLAAFLAVLFIVTLIPVTALAADISGLDAAADGLKASYGGTKWTVSGGTTMTCMCTGSTLKVSTSTLTLTNNSGATKHLAFDYTKTPSGAGDATINGEATALSDSIDVELANGASVEIFVTSGAKKNENKCSFKMENVRLYSNASVTTTFEPAGFGGSYTVDGETITETTALSKIATEPYALQAIPAEGYRFYAWMTDTGEHLGYDAACSMTFDQPKTVTAVFCPADAAIFGVGHKQFADLNEAIACAVNENQQKIILLNDGTLPAGNYTIPSGKIFLVPMDDLGTAYATEPNVIFHEKGYPYDVPTAYRTLTMAEGASITVESGARICVPSNLCAQDQNADSYNGTPCGPHGRIDMLPGSAITLRSGGALYCYGYIAGSGSVTAESGSTVYEAMQFRSWRGGTAATATKPVFPMNQYYIQNIEAPLTLHAGATETVFAAVNIGSADMNTSAAFVGVDNGMFRLLDGTVTKRYDGATDRLILDVNGSVELASMAMRVGDFPIDSAEYVLPINSNITIHIHSGTTTVASSQDVALLPGAVMTVDAGANVNVGSSLFIYDKDQWGPYACANTQLVPVGYSTVNGTTVIRDVSSLVDAVLDVNGTVTVSGKLYTTQSGAAITSSEGTGKVVLTAAAPANGNTQQVTQSGSLVFFKNIPVTAAKLLNADGSYTATAGAAANTTYSYCGVHDKWEKAFTITWAMDDGTVIDTTTVPEGEMPTHADVSKPATDEFIYTFTGWNPQITAATGDCTYTAAFSAVSRVEITFLAPDYPGDEMLTLKGETDSAAVKQQPNYPSYFGYTFAGVTVACGGQTETVAAENGVVTNEALNAAIGRVLAASAEKAVTITANYEKNTETYTITVVNATEDGAEISRYTSDAIEIGNAAQLTAAPTHTANGETVYFDHWEVSGTAYPNAVITLRPNKAGEYTATAVYKAEEPAAPTASVSILGAEAETVNGVHKTAVTMTWSLPEGCTLVKAGFEVSQKADLSKISKAATKLTTATGTYTLHVKMAGKEDVTLYVRSFLIYTDADGEQHTLYTDPWQQYVWNTLNNNL